LARKTKDHDIIRQWALARSGTPAIVKGTRNDATGGIIQIQLPDSLRSGTLEPISWDEFFKIFDLRELTFTHSPREDSKFFKILSNRKHNGN
jgi:hypothetical protein